MAAPRRSKLLQALTGKTLDERSEDISRDSRARERRLKKEIFMLKKKQEHAKMETQKRLKKKERDEANFHAMEYQEIGMQISERNRQCSGMRRLDRNLESQRMANNMSKQYMETAQVTMEMQQEIPPSRVSMAVMCSERMSEKQDLVNEMLHDALFGDDDELSSMEPEEGSVAANLISKLEMGNASSSLDRAARVPLARISREPAVSADCPEELDIQSRLDQLRHQ